MTGVAANDRTITSAFLVNTTKSNVNLIREFEWSGFWEKGGPLAIIPPGEINQFNQIGVLPDGSKAGFKYVSPLGHQWVVAWHVPFKNESADVLNKVYFEDGPAGDVDWDAIEKKLDEQDVPQLPPVPAGFAAITQDSKATLIVAFMELDTN